MHPDLLKEHGISIKDVENRGWYPEQALSLIVRAGGFDTGFFRNRKLREDVIAVFAKLIGQEQAERLNELLPKSKDDYLTGGIVGKCRIVQVLGKFDRSGHPWKVSGEYGLVLQDIQELPFVPVPGDFKLFNIPKALLQNSASQLFQ